jgi:hypothetical protein
LKKLTPLILTIFLLLFSNLDSNAQFKTKKVRFKAIKNHLFHNPIGIAKIKIHTRLKVGYGLPQGVIGINGEFGVERFATTAGIGYAAFRNTIGTIGFHVGFRGYFFTNEHNFRPRISSHYGLSNIYKENEINTLTYGPTVGIGFEHKVTDFIVYDLEYIFRINSLNTYRPANKTHESFALPQIGIGIYL